MDKRKTEIEVAKMLNAYFEDTQRNGFSAEFNYLDSTEAFFWVPPGYKQAIGYDSVKAAINSSAGRFKYVHNTWTTLRIQPLSFELASYTGNIHSVLIDTTADTTEFSLIETGMVIKRESGWKLLCGQTSILE